MWKHTKKDSDQELQPDPCDLVLGVPLFSVRPGMVCTLSLQGRFPSWPHQILEVAPLWRLARHIRGALPERSVGVKHQVEAPKGAGSTGQKSSWPKGIGPRLSWQAHLTDCVLLLDNIHQGKSSIPFPQRVGFPLSPLNTMASRSATPKERVGPQPIYLSQPIYL